MSRLRLALLALLPACVPDHGMYPGGTPGGPGGPTGGGGPDAAVGLGGDGGGGPRISGRVCVTSDLRVGAPCATLAGSLLRVTVAETGANTTISPVDGSFSLGSFPADASGATVTLFTATNDATYFGGARVVILPADGNVVTTLPVMTRNDQQTLLADNQAFVAAGDAILVAHALHGGAAQAGVSASTAGGASPLYDAGTATLYSPSPPTGSRGTILWFDVPARTVSFTVGAKSVSVAVVPDTIQLVDVSL